MDKILDRLGIFDLIAVFLPGIIAMGLSIVADEAVFKTGLSGYADTDEIVLFLVISYLVGTIFQELGSLVYKYLMNANNAILIRALDTNRKNCKFTKAEKKAVQKIVQKELCLDDTPNDTQLFHYCRYSGGTTAHSDKEQSLAAMSLSLSLYFFLLSAMVAGWSILQDENSYWYVIVIAMLIGVLFLHRSTRYYSVRFVRIVRTFYYKYINEIKH